jgi:hypothetical protein
LNFNVRNEIARGYLLLGVFFMHGLWFYTAPMPDWHSAPIPFSILKLLGPDVSIYYLLTGMSLTGIGRKSFRAVLPQSLMLIFMAWVSEGLGIIAVQLLYGNYHAGLPFFKAAIKPMVYGTGGITVITWFFTTLAVARLLVWIFEKNKIYFTLAWLIILGLILASNELNWPDSLYEWPDWPMATLLMIIGLKFPKDWAVPRAIGLASLPLSLLLIWFDVPGMLSHFPCLTCQIAFVAAPEVGATGFLPAYIAAQFLFFLFLLWAAQVSPPMARNIGRYFGRPSLQFLLMHGWVLVTIWPMMSRLYPQQGNFIVPWAMLVFIPLTHAAIFKATETPLNRVLALCFKAGRTVTDWIYLLPGLAIAARHRFSHGRPFRAG